MRLKHLLLSQESKDRCLVSSGAYIFNMSFLEQVLKNNRYQDVGKELLPDIVNTNHVHAHHLEKSCIQNPNYQMPFWRSIEKHYRLLVCKHGLN